MPALKDARILVTGAGGQLGSALLTAWKDLDVISRPRTSLDLTNAAATTAEIVALRPDVIVNCAALNDVDGAEDRPLDALAVNAFAIRSLARAAEEIDATLVHYSTDFVFDGETDAPYTEESTPAPRSTYAASKLLGEWFALDVPRAYVMRVESLFGNPTNWQGRRGSLEGILDGLAAGRDVRVFVDRVVSPTYLPDIAAATRHLLETGAPRGVYHCVNSGHATWHAVATTIAEMLGVPPRLIPITLETAAMKAPRPRYCALDNGKLAAAGFAMPTWRNALERWLQRRGLAGAVK